MKFSGNLEVDDLLVHSNQFCNGINNRMGTNLSNLLSRNRWVNSAVQIDKKYASFESMARSVENLSTSIGVCISQSYSDKYLATPSRGILKRSISCTNAGEVVADELTLKDTLPIAANKNVSFADDNNLNLFEVRSYIPSWERLDDCGLSDDESTQRFSFQNSSSMLPSLRSSVDSLNNNGCFKKVAVEIATCFLDPCQKEDVFELVNKNNVALEKCFVRDRTVTGIIITKNIDYHKEIFIRYTLNKWQSFNDIEATYVPKSSDGKTDRFMFSVCLPPGFQDLIFAVNYKVANREYWDNNNGLNYRIRDIKYE